MRILGAVEQQANTQNHNQKEDKDQCKQVMIRGCFTHAGNLEHKIGE